MEVAQQNGCLRARDDEDDEDQEQKSEHVVHLMRPVRQFSLITERKRKVQSCLSHLASQLAFS